MGTCVKENYCKRMKRSALAIRVLPCNAAENADVIQFAEEVVLCGQRGRSSADDRVIGRFINSRRYCHGRPEGGSKSENGTSGGSMLSN